MTFQIRNGQFVDDSGRQILLRGIDVSANAKYPAHPFEPTYIPTDFHQFREVSFVDHPFRLEEADLHFRRLRRYGFNCIRFVLTWEAIEHAGPDVYDRPYLDYVRSLLQRAADLGFYIYIDPHQDVWSRMSGGDGAPGWTFETVGLDFTKFNASEAAYVMQYRYNEADPKQYPPLYWAANSYRFAPAMMWTLFFGGTHFAPDVRCEGIPIQEYLQNHFLHAMVEVAKVIKDNPMVFGFACLNEPSPGWIGMKMDGSNNPHLNETLGHVFTPIDAMATASGIPRQIGYREVKKFGIKETRKDLLNSGKISCWLPHAEDIWQSAGVWHLDSAGNPEILRNDQFMRYNGENVEFYRDYLSPFVEKYADTVHSVLPETAILFGGPPEEFLKGIITPFHFSPALLDAGHLIFSVPWFDVATVGMKKPMLMGSFNLMTGRPVLGKGNIAAMFVEQLAQIRQIGSTISPQIPTLISEFGIPMDLNQREAFTKYPAEGERVWEKHVECLHLYYDALDANLLSATLWNYTPSNTNQWGDGWNLEDYSIFSPDQQLAPKIQDSGVRALLGFCRPYVRFCAGMLIKQSFKNETGDFHIEFDGDPTIKMPTEIFLPNVQYPTGFSVRLSNGTWEHNIEEQVVHIRSTNHGFQQIDITRR